MRRVAEPREHLQPRRTTGLAVALILLTCWLRVAGVGQEADRGQTGVTAEQASQNAAAPTLKDAFDLLRQNKLDDAEKVFRALIAANPKEIGAYVGLADCLAARGKPAEAVEEYRKAVLLNPKSAELRHGLGRMLEAAGDIGQAVREYRRAGELAPRNPVHPLALAGAYRRVEMYTESLAAAIRALGLDPTNPEVHLLLGAIREGREEWEAALSSYRAAERLIPGDLRARLGAIGALNGAGRYGEAEAQCRTLLAANPTNTDLQLALAVALDGLGRHREAQAVYEELLKAQPDAAVLWGNLGWSQYLSGDIPSAIVSSRKALERDAQLTYVHYNLGLYLAIQGNSEGAMAAYQKAMEVGTRGDLRAALRDVHEAMRRYPATPALQEAAALLENRLRTPAEPRLRQPVSDKGE